MDELTPVEIFLPKDGEWINGSHHGSQSSSSQMPSGHFQHLSLLDGTQRRGSIRDTLEEIDEDVSAVAQEAHGYLLHGQPNDQIHGQPNDQIHSQLNDQGAKRSSLERVERTRVRPSSANEKCRGCVNVVDANGSDETTSLRMFPAAVSNSFERHRKRRASEFEKQVLEFRHLDLEKSRTAAWKAKMSSVLCWLTLFAAILAVLDVECYYLTYLRHTHPCAINTSTQSNSATLNLKTYTPSSLSIALKALVTIDSILSSTFLYMYYRKECHLLIIRYYLPRKATVLTSPLRKRYLFELMLCLCHIPPYGDLYVPIELQLVLFLRLYLIERYMQNHSQVQQKKGTLFLASVMDTVLSPGFLVKTYFLKRPFTFISMCYLLNLIGVGYLAFAADRQGNPCNHNSLMNSIWMLAVTMTTLGFGDVTPHSTLGRVFVSISSMCGIFLMALMISVIHELLLLTQPEKRILAYIERQDFTSKRKELAAMCIQATWRLYNYNKWGKMTPLNRYKLRKFLRSVKLVSYRKFLTQDLYDALFKWRHIRTCSSPDDYWMKDFVADNMAIQLTNVSRKIDLIQEHLAGGGSDENQWIPESETELCSKDCKGGKTGHTKMNVAETSPRYEDGLKTEKALPSEEEWTGSPSWQQVLELLNAMQAKLTSMDHSFQREIKEIREMIKEVKD